MALSHTCIVASIIFIIFTIIPTKSWPFSQTEVADTETRNLRLIRASIRNIILVGKSRSGKSTIIEVLKDPDHDPAEFKILRGTVNAKLNSFTLQSDNRAISMHFNIMDTPGLFERTASIKSTRANRLITQTIIKCVDTELTKINHVYYVMSINHGISTEDVQAFQIFAELFVGMEDKISIILSFTQNVVIDRYSHYINQFTEVPELRPIHEKIKGRIFFLGAAKNDDFADMEKLRKNVAGQRNALITHIMNQNGTYNVKNLKIYKENLHMIRNLRRNLTSCCETNCVDIDALDGFISHYSVGSQQVCDENEDECEDDEDAPNEVRVSEKLIGF